jgi:hypothetical protein
MRRSVIALLAVVLLSLSMQAQAQDKQTIRFKVTKEGLVTSDIKMDGKRMAVPQGTRVRLVFKYADTNGNAHQFTVHSAQMELTGQRMSPDGPKTSALEWTVGEKGEDFYRISCDLPCLAMEELTDYLVMVTRPTRS